MDMKDSVSSPKDTSHVTSSAKSYKSNDTVASKSSPGMMYAYTTAVVVHLVCIYVCMYISLCIHLWLTYT